MSLIANPVVFFLTQFSISLVVIFLRGVQTQNVVHGDYKGAAVTSLLMSVANVAFIGLVSTDVIASLIPSALGGTIGVLLSMKFKRRK